MEDRLQVIGERVTALTQSVDSMQAGVTTLTTGMAEVKQDINQLQQGYTALHTSVAALSASFEQMDKRFDDFSSQTDKRLGDFSSQIDKRFGDFNPQNWLRVLGPTESPQINQGVSYQLHPIVPLLDVLETEQQPLEFVLPGKRSLHAIPSCMNRSIAQPLPPSLGRFAIARVLRDVRNHPGIEDDLAIVL
jgi:hypothetical protein